MQTLYLLCGLIGSGKSTWASDRTENNTNTIIINRDKIREMIHGKYAYKKETEDLIRDIAFEIMIMSIGFGFDIIIDEINITKEKRQLWVNIARKKNPDIKIVCVYCTEKKDNVFYRMKDSKGVDREAWERVYEGMLKSFEEPTIEEFPDNCNIIEIKIYEEGELK